jgi:hypothetical protein
MFRCPPPGQNLGEAMDRKVPVVAEDLVAELVGLAYYTDLIEDYINDERVERRPISPSTNWPGRGACHFSLCSPASPLRAWSP